MADSEQEFIEKLITGINIKSDHRDFAELLACTSFLYYQTFGKPNAILSQNEFDIIKYRLDGVLEMLKGMVAE